MIIMVVYRPTLEQNIYHEEMGTYRVESLNCIYIIQTVQIIWSLFMVYHLYNFYHSHESKDSIRTEVRHLLHGV